ncbi:RidA family protein [Diaminobutyricimonas sp. LJ205]|uniref:RidA family protein n=1 Tax=Diaminobutyricimonas sp. LJ205 TaxID=2683590 RepID=UPI0012F4B71B|nr:RidA family protein [Diaminobutyricimonas sp. LJ205]
MEFNARNDADRTFRIRTLGVASGGASTEGITMGRILINPAGLKALDAYTHVAIGTGQTVIHFAGQVAFDADGNVIGEGDLRAQVIACMNNLKIAMDAVGATWHDIVRRTVYATELGEPGTIARAIKEVTGDVQSPPQTMVKVAGLALPTLLVEIEATAVIG